MRSVMKGMHTGRLKLHDADIEVKGMVTGDVFIDGDSDVLLSGMVSGNVTLAAGKLYLRGMVRGDVLNEGGELTLRGIVQGAVLTRGGHTVREDVSSKG